jgi:hypothetical protein
MPEPIRRHRNREAVVLAAFLLLAPVAAPAGNLVVPGTANPNLAGRAGGYTCCAGDGSPGQDPVLVQLDFESCDIMEMSVLGRVSYLPGDPTGHNPDGDSTFSMVNYGDGLSAPENVRVNALVGVFLDDDSPTGKATPPRLDFDEIGLGFSYLEPGIGQIFFIGDGLTTDSAGDFLAKSPRGQGGLAQEFRVPPGATRLYLGTVDGEGWFNNSGSFQVEALRYAYNSPTECGDAADPSGIFASDALAVLRGAVGSQTCSPCYCDVDHSGKVVAGDALSVLRSAVGQGSDLECPCCQIF